VAQYVERFADHFGLTDRITFNTPVVSVAPVPGPGRPGSNGWLVTPQGQEPRAYEDVLVCNGHHHKPRFVELPGAFFGEALRSSAYQEPSRFAGKYVTRQLLCCVSWEPDEPCGLCFVWSCQPTWRSEYQGVRWPVGPLRQNRRAGLD
jgi:hypothetical protein